jgi:hypothetical protein
MICNYQSLLIYIWPKQGVDKSRISYREREREREREAAIGKRPAAWDHI